MPVGVRFGALGNAPFAAIGEPATGHRYQRAYAHAHTLGGNVRNGYAGSAV